MPTPPDTRLAELGIVLPEAPKPVAAYIPSRRAGALLFISGQIPVREGKLIHAGLVGRDVSLDQARECARQCLINGLAVAKSSCGSLASISRVIKVGCFVACTPDFVDHPKVANGCSELLQEIFGERGQHARAAVGAPSLPLNAPVEIEFIFEVDGSCP